MIETVTMERSTYAPVPHKFEAGTPPIVEAVGLGAAVDYLTELGMDAVHTHEQAVTAYALEGLATIPGLTVLGPLDATQRGGAISFEIPGVHPHDVATVLDTRGIAVRAGHRACAVRRAELDAHVVLPLHDAGRDRRARRGPGIHPPLLQVELNIMSTELDSLYQEIILDHYRNPHHKGLREPFEAEVHHVNPTCGDEVTLRVHVADGKVADVSYDALGCSISQASASVMTDLVIGKSVDEAMAIHEEFLTLMQGKGQVEPDEEVLEDGIAFAGVARFPARIKCALLSWMAWKDATTTAQMEEMK